MRRGAGAVLLVLLLGCGSTTPADDAPAAPGSSPGAGWTALPPGPLSARHSALAVSVDDRLLLLGGRDTALCPPTASCAAPDRPALTDVAAYDVASGRWTELAPLPVPVSAQEGQAIRVGDAVHVLVSRGAGAGTHLRHADGAWERLADAPEPEAQLVAAGELLVAHATTQERGDVRDHVYDPRTGQWEALPPDPLVPSYDRAMTWTGELLVLTGPKVTPSPGGEDGPSFVRSAVLDLRTRQWQVLPAQSTLIGYGTERSWDGRHVVSPYVQSFDGGQTNGYGRALPTGGLLDLDTGQWAPLPDPPQPGDGRYRALSEQWVTAGEGLVLDTARPRWIPLPDHDADADQGESAAWVGDQLLVWGGGGALVDGGRVETPLVATGAVWSAPR